MTYERTAARLGRQVFGALLAAFLVCALAVAHASEKKGIGLGNRNDPSRIEALNVSWYYNWSPYPTEGAPANKFVPMVWGGSRLDEHMKAVQRSGKPPIVLLINEPDNVNQANMSVDEVARIWPTLAALGEKVSSPTPAGSMGPWLERFDKIGRARNLKYDFIAIHLYTAPDPKRLLDRLDEVYARYKMPIWITEFAVADHKADESHPNRYTDEETLAFMKAVLPELERRSFVQRYAWFGAGEGGKEQVKTSRLFNKDGSMTPLGKFYASFGSTKH